MDSYHFEHSFDRSLKERSLPIDTYNQRVLIDLLEEACCHLNVYAFLAQRINSIKVLAKCHIQQVFNPFYLMNEALFFISLTTG
jgi:hypothetical protein